MNKLFIFLTIVSSLLSCGGKKEQSFEKKTSKNQDKQPILIIAKKNQQHIDVKKDPNDFIPKGYVLHKYKGGIFSGGWEEIKGDLNKDGLEDLVLIIKATDKSKIINDEYQGKLDRNRRGIIVLFKKGESYQLASQNINCFSSENEDGGIYFAPELSVYIDKGNLTIEYGHGRYGWWKYTFRYQNGDMELIGYDLYSCRGPVPQYEVSINFLTKKQVIKDNINKDLEGDNYEVKYQETWKKVKVKNLLRLTEIEDFDELNFEI